MEKFEKLEIFGKLKIKPFKLIDEIKKINLKMNGLSSIEDNSIENLKQDKILLENGYYLLKDIKGKIIVYSIVFFVIAILINVIFFRIFNRYIYIPILQILGVNLPLDSYLSERQAIPYEAVHAIDSCLKYIIGILWAIIITLYCFVYYYLIGTWLLLTKKKLKYITMEIENHKLATEDGKKRHLEIQLRKLTNATAEVFFSNKTGYNQAKEWRDKAADILYNKGENTDLIEAESFLTSMNELIHREKKEQNEQKIWQVVAVLIMVAYIAGIIFFAFFMGYYDLNNFELIENLPGFNIPYSIILWSATGSLAAILYRFYTEKDRIKLSSEVRWLIARPIIGIIMGAVVYLALFSGLTFMNLTLTTSDAQQLGKTEVYWIIAFLAGFSDKFYIGIIKLLVDRTLNSDNSQENEEKTQV